MPDLYWFSLALGGAGLAGMAVLGAYGSGAHGGHSGDEVGHFGHGGGGIGHADHVGHGGGHIGYAGQVGQAGDGIGHSAHPAADVGHAGHSGAVGHAGHAAGHGHGSESGTAHAHHAPAHQFPNWGVLLSPRVIFSALVGFGAVGIALRAVLAGPWLFAAALAGGIAFEALLIGPVWNLLLRFGSRPALTLDHGVMDEAEAVTAFNAQGDGLVKLVVDGQVVQLLGTLVAAERAAGVRVRAGDRLVIESVDGARQRCTVSRHGPP